MHCNQPIRRQIVWLVALAATAAMFSRAASAAEPLRWKFQAGDKFNYQVVQDMTTNMNAGPAGQMVTTLRQTLDMIWDVERVNEDGTAVIQQTVDRVKLSMNSPTGQNVAYDSDAEGPAEGLAAMVAPMYEAMIEDKFEFTMTPRGEIQDVKVPAKVLEAIKNSPGAAVAGDMATAEGLQSQLMQLALVFPENSPEVGESWSNSVTINNPMAGKHVVETSFKYEGTSDVDGVAIAVFRPTLKMAMEGNDAVQVKVTEQESEGEVLFNQDAGRLDSIKLQQMTKMDITVAGQALEQEIDQQIEVKVTPAAEPAAESPRSEE